MTILRRSVSRAPAISRIQDICCWLAMVVATALSATALGQSYPVKPVRIVVGSAAGGPIDVLARLTSQRLSQVFDQQFPVENRLGAGGTIAGEYVAKSARDGYTLHMGSAATLCIAPAIYPKLAYDPVADFSPISAIAGTSFVMVAHPSIPARSVKEFISLARARPGQLRYGSAGSGSGTHLSVELFRSMSKIDVVHVPYKGGAQAIIDVISGQIDFMFATAGGALPHIQTGKLRALGVTGSGRSPSMPTLPTIAEGGVAGYDSTTWFGLLGPAGMPRDAVNRLGAALRKLVASQDFRQQMQTHDLDPIGNTPEQFAHLIQSDLAKWAQVVRASNARAE